MLTCLERFLKQFGEFFFAHNLLVVFSYFWLWQLFKTRNSVKQDGCMLFLFGAGGQRKFSVLVVCVETKMWPLGRRAGCSRSHCKISWPSSKVSCSFRLSVDYEASFPVGVLNLHLVGARVYELSLHLRHGLRGLIQEGKLDECLFTLEFCKYYDSKYVSKLVENREKHLRSDRKNHI